MIKKEIISFKTVAASMSGRAALMTLLAAGSLLSSALAFAAGNDFVKIESSHSFSATVSALKSSVTSNHMMIMGNLNQGRVMSMTGMSLKGESFFVGSPVMGKKAFTMSPAAGVAIPARMYIWENKGKTYIGYIKPSALLTKISPEFAMPGGMLDKKLSMIAEDAAK